MGTSLLAIVLVIHPYGMSLSLPSCRNLRSESPFEGPCRRDARLRDMASSVSRPFSSEPQTLRQNSLVPFVSGVARRAVHSHSRCSTESVIPSQPRLSYLQEHKEHPDKRVGICVPGRDLFRCPTPPGHSRYLSLKCSKGRATGRPLRA